MFIIPEATGSLGAFAPLPDGLLFTSGRPREYKGSCGNLRYDEFNYSHIAGHLLFLKGQIKITELLMPLK